MMKSFVYILTNQYGSVFYTGVTSDIKQRISQHRNKTFGGFSAKYNLTRVVHIEEYPCIMDAILREKHIKMMSRERKMRLINEANPDWEDLM